MVWMLGLVLLFSRPVNSHDFLTTPQLVQKSELVVIGKVSERKDLDAFFATATLTVHDVIKGDRALKTIKVKLPHKSGNTDMGAFQFNEEGLWFLAPVGDGLYSTFNVSGFVSTNTFKDEPTKKEINTIIEDARKAVTESKAASPAPINSHEPITPEQLVKHAELIVIGKLSGRKEVDAQWATATLTIQELMKGDQKLKTVTVKFLAKPGNTATWTYEGTEEGIWFLAPAGEGLYATFHSNGLVRTTFTEEAAKKQVKDFIDTVRRIINPQLAL